MGPRRTFLALLLAATILAGCSFLIPDAAPTGGSAATWYLDPAAPAPGPDDTSFVAMVTERACSSGRDISDILMPPVIEYGAETVAVSLYVEPFPGLAANCIGTMPTRFTIALGEPLGDRRLVDGIGGTDDDPRR